MKVLHVYKTYFPDTYGGLEQAIRHICLSTAQAGVKNRVLTLQANSGAEQISFPEAKIYRAPRQFSISSCDVGFGLFKLFKEQSEWCDVVHFHFPWPFADLLQMVSGSKPYIITYHSDVVRQRYLSLVYHPLMRSFLEGADTIIATSPNYADSSSILGRFRQKVKVIPLGMVDTEYPDPGEETLERMRNIYGQDFYFFVGVFRYYKGLDILLQAMKGAGHKLVIAGIGPEETKLKKLAVKLKLDNVSFAGKVNNEEKLALFSLCRAVIFPSSQRSEAFGMTLLEGAMMGKPLISTELGTGTSYINKNEETGLVIKAGCSTALRSGMDALAMDHDVLTRYGLNARARYEKYFSGEKIGQQYQETYSSVLEQASCQ